MGGMTDNAVMMYQTDIPYGFLLGLDHIREYVSDPSSGPDHGFLILKSQVNTGGSVWLEPLDHAGNRRITRTYAPPKRKYRRVP